MALSWVLAALSLLPLLHAQSPVCANLTAAPITNATLDLVRPLAPERQGQLPPSLGSPSPAGLWSRPPPRLILPPSVCFCPLLSWVLG